MDIKKLFAISFLMMNSIAQSYDMTDDDFKTLKKIGTTGLIVSGTAYLVYLCATSGDSVEQRIADAQEDLATMPEYGQEFDLEMHFKEKETQIQANLDQLHIDLSTLTHYVAHDQKLKNDLAVLEKTYNNLWFKSLYGGEEIAAMTRKVYAYKLSVQALLKYLQDHDKFIEGHKIMNESSRLVHRSLFKNEHEMLKAAQNHDVDSLYPLITYANKFEKDLACVQFLTTDKKSLQDYPQLSIKIAEYKERLQEIRDAILSLDLYKQQVLRKLEIDVALLIEQHKQLSAAVQRLQFEVQMLRISQR
jgi:hypothetical protein